MKIARIFRHTDSLIYVCDDAAPGLSTEGGGFASKAAAISAARAKGYTHATGSGTYGGNAITDLSKGSGFSVRKFAADKRRRTAASETHTQLDLDRQE